MKARSLTLLPHKMRCKLRRGGAGHNTKQSEKARMGRGNSGGLGLFRGECRAFQERGRGGRGVQRFWGQKLVKTQKKPEKNAPELYG